MRAPHARLARESMHELLSILLSKKTDILEVVRQKNSGGKSLRSRARAQALAVGAFQIKQG